MLQSILLNFILKEYSPDIFVTRSSTNVIFTYCGIQGKVSGDPHQNHPMDFAAYRWSPRNPSLHLGVGAQACEASQRAAVAEYERIKSRNLDEWERLTNERQHDFSLMLSGVARVQAAHAERAASVWLAVSITIFCVGSGWGYIWFWISKHMFCLVLLSWYFGADSFL